MRSSRWCFAACLDNRSGECPLVGSGQTRKRKGNREKERQRKGRTKRKVICQRSAKTHETASETTRLTRSCSSSTEMMTLQALEVRRYRSACYAAPCAPALVPQAVVFDAIVDSPQLPAFPKILDRDDRKEAHHKRNQNRRYGIDHGRW
jgi:hypothetical protein